MKRLTKRWGEQPYPNLAGKVVCEYKECDSARSCKNCIHGRYKDRLAAIEDILGDEYELDDLKKAMWCMEIVEMAFAADTNDIERLWELWFADREGRCEVLPCKVGDTIYRIEYIESDGFKIGIGEHKFDYLFFALERKNFGKTVFLTREEAEKAQKAREQDD